MKKKADQIKDITESNTHLEQDVDTAALLKAAPESPMPECIKPMLATLVDAPFDDPDWQYEVKWDGFRTLAYVQSGKADLLSRKNKSFSEKYYPIHELLKSWKLNVVLDGEILVLNESGVSKFSSLQNWRSEADGALVYYVFDLLWYEGKDLMELPLYQRQAILKDILPKDDDRVRIGQVFTEKGTAFFKDAEKLELEGIMAKRRSSTYTPDLRSNEWLKIKVHQRQEAIIAGYTKNEGTNKLFSSLLLGVYEKGEMQFVGKVGTGFTKKVQEELINAFKPYITEKSAFKVIPDINKPSRFRPNPPKADVTWLRPELICEVAYVEMTSDGVFRQPSFQGMRSDKKASEIVREVARHSPKAAKAAPLQADEAFAGALKPPKVRDRATLVNPKDDSQVRPVCGHDIKFANLGKLYWPEEQVSKRDMLNFYYQIADYILPYLKDRPLSLNRFPNGIHGKSFYQKDVKGKAPDWAETFPYTTSDGKHKEFLVGNNEDTLLWAATSGCIEMNPWFSRTHAPDNPDYCVIDLDPDQNTFEQVIEAAIEVRKVLDALGVPTYPKTSGSTGLHIYIPLGAKYTYDESQNFARKLVHIVNEQLPEFTTVERFIENRGGKMYLDFLQNRPGATIAGPYSLRPKPGATVSMPLHWDEVKPGLTMKDFTIFNAVNRLKMEGDLFKPILGKGIDLEKVLNKANSQFGK
ncbi:DNA ligase D [Mucilaginibacter sp. Bleaf8]|uniref:DNA ligase D n=1 Tax=Mucilaginibacter sp. Bleaf8 TaxID=2834430 RepID=UPI001BCCBAE6|nr:DNA ligase D [Mucilaginibacter sp. Bleaf8]MBS7566692.1 DNA ligase D [Mucilaginibacter sp. Bleaf8]